MPERTEAILHRRKTSLLPEMSGNFAGKRIVGHVVFSPQFEVKRQRGPLATFSVRH